MMNDLERLQKVMANCGVASRRKCEELITAGRVKVNGNIVTELGFKVSKKDSITVDDKMITKEEKVYYALYKPTGYITTVSDEKNRRTVMDLFLPEDKQNRIFPVGRLDYDTSGIIIMTNDGELSNKLTNSANDIEKVYLARVEGIMTIGNVLKLQKGVIIDGVKTKRAKVEVVSFDKAHGSTLARITITEGKNRQVRKMFETIGFPVKKLKRESFAGISLDGLIEGSYRPLKIHEVRTLFGL